MGEQWICGAAGIIVRGFVVLDRVVCRDILVATTHAIVIMKSVV